MRKLSSSYEKCNKSILKFVILRYDEILHTEYAKPTAIKSSIASSEKFAKSFLAKKSAKLPELSRAQ